MSLEGHFVDRKSLDTVIGKKADYSELAKDCVAFANAQGGRLLIGIEDGQADPPANQTINPDLPDQIRKRIGEITVGVHVFLTIEPAENGGQYVDLSIPRSIGVASTSDGRYYLRVSDNSKPVLGDDIFRLAAERAALPWEKSTTLNIPRSRLDAGKWSTFKTRIQNSDRVKSFVKTKTDDELLDHYEFAAGEWLTHLGLLCVGLPYDRSCLETAPIIQFIKYDEKDRKINKIVWDDYTLNPMELVDAVRNEVPDWKESYEIRGGLYPHTIPIYDDSVVRELLVNALVHRPYTQRGDIFINLYPDRLEIVNPGLLPLGVTPANILHVTVRRNEGLARVFHDLKLMEREGSGFDQLYEVLLSQGRERPQVKEGFDRVEVTVKKHILNPLVIDFMGKADEWFQLTQKEKICLGLIAQHEALTAIQLERLIELTGSDALKPWLGRLTDLGLVRSSGKTKGTTYFVPPDALRKLEFQGPTTLRRIEPHRLRELILRDLDTYPHSKAVEIHARVGTEIPLRTLQAHLKALVDEKLVQRDGHHYQRATDGQKTVTGAIPEHDPDEHIS